MQMDGFREDTTRHYTSTELSNQCDVTRDCSYNEQSGHHFVNSIPSENQQAFYQQGLDSSEVQAAGNHDDPTPDCSPNLANASNTPAYHYQQVNQSSPEQGSEKSQHPPRSATSSGRELSAAEDSDDDANSNPRSHEKRSRSSNLTERQAQPKPFSKKNLKRHRLSHSETRFLLNQFGQNPHPDAAQRAQLSRQVNGLSARQIQVWFQNRRAKLKRMSASDADRMLSTRSYPEGYGPAGFEGSEQDELQDTSKSLFLEPVPKIYGSHGYADSLLHAKSAPPEISHYANDISGVDVYQSTKNYTNHHPSTYSRSPMQSTFVSSRYSAQQPAQTSPRSHIADMPNLTQSLPLPAYNLASTYGQMYNSNLRSPTMQSSDRTAYDRQYTPASHSVYTARPTPPEGSYNNTFQMSRENNSPYSTYPVSEQRELFHGSDLPPTKLLHTVERTQTNTFEQAPYHVDAGHAVPYLPRRMQIRPYGYNQSEYPPAAAAPYEDVPSTRSIYGQGDARCNNFQLAPLMERESKAPYVSNERPVGEVLDYAEGQQGFTTRYVPEEEAGHMSDDLQAPCSLPTPESSNEPETIQEPTSYAESSVRDLPRELTPETALQMNKSSLLEL